MYRNLSSYLENWNSLIKTKEKLVKFIRLAMVRLEPTSFRVLKLNLAFKRMMLLASSITFVARELSTKKQFIM